MQTLRRTTHPFLLTGDFSMPEIVWPGVILGEPVPLRRTARAARILHTMAECGVPRPVAAPARGANVL